MGIKRSGTGAERAIFEGDLGKLPPQNVELEEIILGAIILEKNIILDVQDTLKAEYFYKNEHTIIYSAIVGLAESGNPIDIVTVVNRLKKDGTLDIVGGPYAITQLANRVGSGANIKEYIKVIQQHWVAREIIRIGANYIRYAFEDTSDPLALLQNMDTEIQAISDSINDTGESEEYVDQINEALSVIEKLTASEIKISGIPTGNPKLDAITGGWQNTDLIILAGRPGMGKTTRAMMAIKAALHANKKVALFSLEMGKIQIIQKQLNEETEILIKDLRTGNINPLQLQKVRDAAAKLEKLNLFIHDKSSISIPTLRNICKRRKKKFGLDLIVVDYLQLMKASERFGRSRENEVSEISAGLKSIAKELNVPLIALSQISRQCEQRADKRPVLSDLRESGGIENDADMVLGCYRPSYYYGTADNDPDYKEEMPDDYKLISQLIILKNRNGQTETFIKEYFRGEVSRFWYGESVGKITPNDVDVPF